jgi:hypothetical protein
MATFTIQNEGTRRALEYALWKYAANQVPECFQDILHLDADSVLTRDPEAIIEQADADSTLAMLRMMQADIDLVRTTDIGDTVEVSPPRKGVVDGLLSLQYAFKETEDFWNCAPDDREIMLVVWDAATQLLADAGPVEAVA